MLNITILLTTILLGSMVFFASIVAPSIFKTLKDNDALKFTRYLFPKYYLWCIGVCSLSLLFAVVAKSSIFIPLLIILIGFIYSRQLLTPKISEAKDQWLASDSPEDKARYKSLHKRSVIINAIQMILLLIIVVTNQVMYPHPA